MMTDKRLGLYGWVALGALVRLAGGLHLPGRSEPVPAGEPTQFPTVSGSNLERRALTFPRDFVTPFNLLFIPFQQWQQRLVDTWVPAARALEQEFDTIQYYELPTVWEMGPLRRMMLNEGMRAGIPDEVARARTVTLYLDKAAFRRRLDMPTEETIYVLLVRGDGTIVWRTEGAYSAEKEAALRTHLTA